MGMRMRIQQQIGSQGCRFGSESKPNPGHQYLDPWVPSVAFFLKMYILDTSATLDHDHRYALSLSLFLFKKKIIQHNQKRQMF